MTVVLLYLGPPNLVWISIGKLSLHQHRLTMRLPHMVMEETYWDINVMVQVEHIVMFIV